MQANHVIITALLALTLSLATSIVFNDNLALSQLIVTYTYLLCCLVSKVYMLVKLANNVDAISFRRRLWSSIVDVVILGTVLTTPLTSTGHLTIFIGRFLARRSILGIERTFRVLRLSNIVHMHLVSISRLLLAYLIAVRVQAVTSQWYLELHIPLALVTCLVTIRLLDTRYEISQDTSYVTWFIVKTLPIPPSVQLTTIIGTRSIAMLIDQCRTYRRLAQ